MTVILNKRWAVSLQKKLQIQRLTFQKILSLVCKKFTMLKKNYF